MPRKRCECPCRAMFSAKKDRQRFIDRSHYMRSRSSETHQTYGRKGGQAARATNLRKAAERAAGACGTPLTKRELAIYQRGRYNGYSQGFAAGKRYGLQRHGETHEKFERGERILNRVRTTNWDRA